ncbi:MAG: alanine racemase [Candidatus Zixiibacteriota bacterium]
MTRSSYGLIMRFAELLKRQIPRLDPKELKIFVQSFLDRRDDFLLLAEKEGCPLYAIDRDGLIDKSKRFRNAFAEAFPAIRVYYALKSNNHPLIASTLVKEGLGLDVSSGLELKLALECDSRDIIFSGPGKQPDELRLAIENSNRVTVLLDSFRDLAKLESTASQSETRMRAGVRLTTDETSIWKKFGIPLNRLKQFFEEARECKWVDLCGLQFHISWNLSPKSQVIFIADLGTELRRLDKKFREKIKFIDIGGGFWPEEGEWLQPAATPRGILQKALSDNTINGLEHYKYSASSIGDFAEQISASLGNNLPEDINCTICFEPGRWLCNNAMHILVKVVDVKSHDIVITDGGTNAVGWERFESDYFPVINLTRPGLKEHECLIAGSLCTPHDLWGYSYFGDKIDEGDILLIPNQGAYTYSLKQEFIKPPPKCALLATEILVTESKKLMAKQFNSRE